MNLNHLRDRAYKIACDHGFHDKELSNEHFLCLAISELMEAVEADRKGKRADKVQFGYWQLKSPGLTDEGRTRSFKEDFSSYIKDTVEDELADACIRLLDFAGARKLNMNRFALVNIVSKKKTFTENIYSIIKNIVNYKYSNEERVNYAILQIKELASILNIDLEFHITQKMAYNELRENMHGKKY